MKSIILIVVLVLSLHFTLHADDSSAKREYLLAIITNQFSQDFELTIIDLEGRKAFEFPKSIRGNHPAWSPCGKWIALEREGNIVMVSADGSTSRHVTNDQHRDEMPSWSPDGRQITFFSWRDGNLEVMIVNADGIDVRNLTNDPATDADPAWYPGGEEIIFLSNRSKDWRLYIVGTDGIGLRLFSDQPTRGLTYPAWTPNGRCLAFAVSDQSGAHQLLISDRNGRTTRQITHGSGVHSWAAWSPDARYLAYCRLEEGRNINEANGDLIIYDVLRDTHRPVLAAALWKRGSRVSWKPFNPHGSQHVIQQASEAVQMEASNDPVRFPDAPPPLAVAPFESVQARQHQKNWAEYLGIPVEWTNWLGMKFVLIPPGEFEMGSAEEGMKEILEEITEKLPNWYTSRYVGVDRLSSEVPKHRVRITKPFYMGAHEVTQYQYQQLMGNKLHPVTEDWNRPMGMVTWEEAVVFCRALTGFEHRDAPGGRYSLPTEAQWEYACRAGTNEQYGYESNDTLDRYAWYAANSADKPHPVGLKQPNAWGLYDTYGNEWEWCWDWYDSSYYGESPVDDPSGPSGPTAGERRVIRGGSYTDDKFFCRPSFRYGAAPDFRGPFRGFRVVITIPYAQERLATPFEDSGTSEMPTAEEVPEPTVSETDTGPSDP